MICVLGKNVKTQYQLSMENEVFSKKLEAYLGTDSKKLIRKVKETFEKTRIVKNIFNLKYISYEEKEMLEFLSEFHLNENKRKQKLH